MTLHAVSLMINRRLSADVDHYLGRADVRVVPPLCPVDVGPADFGRAAELMERAYVSTTAWLGSAAGAAVNPLAAHDRSNHRRTVAGTVVDTAG